MKVFSFILPLLLSLIILQSCTDAPVIDQEIRLSPDTLAFSISNPDTQYIAITHSCTCPFSWSFFSDLSWLKMQGSGEGDQNHLPFYFDTATYWQSLATGGDSSKIKDSLRIADTLMAGEFARDYSFRITSNFGDKDIKVIINK